MDKGAKLKFGDSTDLMILLSQEKDSVGNDYSIHVFQFKENIISWLAKFSVDTNREKIKETRRHCYTPLDSSTKMGWTCSPE